MQDGDARRSRSRTVASAVDRWLASYGSAPADVRRRARRTGGAVFVGVVGFALATIIMLATGQALIAVATFLAVLALVFCGVSLRAGAPIGLVANADITVNATVLFGILLATGGASVGVLIALPVVPALAVLVGSRRSVLFWSGMTIATIVLVLVLTALEFEFPIRPDLSRVAIAKIPITIVVVGVVFGIARLFLDDRERAEQAFLESEQQLKQITEIENSGHFMWNELEGQCIFASKVYARILGVTVDEVLTQYSSTMKDLELVHPDDREQVLAGYAESEKEGRGHDIEYRIIRPDGEERRVREIGHPVLNHQGRIIRTVGILQDVTEQKKAHEALEESEALFKQAARTARLGHCSYDERAGEYLSVSEEYANIFGYTVVEFMRRFRDFKQDALLVVPEDRAKVTEEYEKDGDVNIEYRIVRADGSVRTVHEMERRGPEAPGERASYHCTLQDVTELRHIEERARELQDAQQELTKNLADARRAEQLVNLGTYEWDWTDDRLVACSEEYARIHELSVDEALQVFTSLEADYNYIHPDDRELIAALEAKTVVKREGYSAAYRMLLPSGRICDVQEVCEVELNDQGEVIRTLGSLQDVTEQVELQDTVRTRDVWLRGILDNTPIEIAIKDTEGRIIAISRNVGEPIGRRAEEFIGTTTLDFLPASIAERYMAADQCVAETGQSVQQEVREDVDGVVRYSLNAKFPLKDERGKVTGICSLTSDITDMKETEARLSQSQKMEAVGTLAGGIAHDFNNILTGINGHSQLILEGLKRDDPLYQGLSEIAKAGNRATTLTRQLLAFSRRQILRPEVINLSGAIADMEELLRRLIGEHIEIDIRCDSDMRMVTADPGQMDQVIINLMVNARDAMPQGGNITMSVEDVVLDDQASGAFSDLPAGDYVMLLISDTGIGMCQETLSHIFEPFFTTKGTEKGTGLGLSTVFGIIKQSGGGIEVESELGKGSTFRIYLPKVEASEPVAEEKEHRVSAVDGHETILVVEDEEMIRALLERILERFGYTVLTAHQGEDALLIAAQHDGPIDLVITDVVMPQMSGHELAKRLASLRPEMPVLFMSGYDEEMVADQGIVNPEWQFLQKPFLPKDVVRKIRKILDMHISTRKSAGPDPATSHDHINPG